MVTGELDEADELWPEVHNPVSAAICQLIAAVIEVTPTDCPERKRASRPTEGSADVRCSSAACGGG